MSASEPNGSVAVVLSDGSVAVSVFVRKTGWQTAMPVLEKHYGSQAGAESLVLVGDFDTLRPTRKECLYFVDNGDDILDCAPELFASEDEYREAMVVSGYGNNYLFTGQRWLRLPTDCRPQHKGQHGTKEKKHTV